MVILIVPQRRPINRPLPTQRRPLPAPLEVVLQQAGLNSLSELARVVEARGVSCPVQALWTARHFGKPPPRRVVTAIAEALRIPSGLVLGLLLAKGDA